MLESWVHLPPEYAKPPPIVTRRELLDFTKMLHDIHESHKGDEKEEEELYRSLIFKKFGATNVLYVPRYYEIVMPVIWHGIWKFIEIATWLPPHYNLNPWPVPLDSSPHYQYLSIYRRYYISLRPAVCVVENEYTKQLEPCPIFGE